MVPSSDEMHGHRRAWRGPRLFGVIGGILAVGVAVIALTLIAGTSGSGSPVGTKPLVVTDVPSTLSGAGIIVANDDILLAPAAPATGVMSAAKAISMGRREADARFASLATLRADVTLGYPHHWLTTTQAYVASGAPATTRVIETFNAYDGTPNRIENVPAWVLTFTSPTPVNVAVGGMPEPGQRPPQVLVRHFSIALDARNGTFLRGFYTK